MLGSHPLLLGKEAKLKMFASKYNTVHCSTQQQQQSSRLVKVCAYTWRNVRVSAWMDVYQVKFLAIFVICRNPLQCPLD